MDAQKMYSRSVIKDISPSCDICVVVNMYLYICFVLCAQSNHGIPGTTTYETPSSGQASDTIYTLVDIAQFIFSRLAPKRKCASYRSWFIHFKPIYLRVIYFPSTVN